MSWTNLLEDFISVALLFVAIYYQWHGDTGEAIFNLLFAIFIKLGLIYESQR